MRWLRRRRRRTAAIGTEVAAAVAAEKRHQQVGHRPSPLAGLSYELAAGGSHLFRFVESPTDDLVAAAALGAVRLRGQELVDFRDSLTQDDLYTLLAFARRVAARALRGHADHLPAGWVAVGLVDLERVDWRDAAVAVGLLSYSTTRTNTDLQAPLEDALAVAEPGTAKVLRQYANSGEDGPAVGGYREVATAEGPALVEDYGESYSPTLDLLAVANSAARVVEADDYRVTGITTGTDIAPVWLPAADPGAVEQARERIRACLSISAAHHAEATTEFPDQMFLAYVAECATSEDATLLTQAVKQPTGSDIAALAVSHGRLCVVVIARSTVKGVPPVESTDSIERFRDPLTHALSVQLTDG
jgi:hypothetical protein